MSDKKDKIEEQEELNTESVNVENSEAEQEPELTAEEQMSKDLESAKKELEDSKKEYMFLLAEFDNFRKRTLKERGELIKNAAEKAMENLLPVIDDFERALQAVSESSDVDSLREGVELIYNKFMKYLESNGVKPIESTGTEFNTEFHEAVTVFPAPEESMKGKVIDTVQKGYMINDKVLRHSKVVVGQ